MAQPTFHLKRSPAASIQGAPINALSVDVEDYYQVQALQSHFPRDSWEACVSRVDANTHRILDLLAEKDVKATFFTLAWIAERHRSLIRSIVDQGHELASHGYAHIRADAQSPEDFRSDIAKTKHILEDIGGTKVSGYRAATFSISEKNFWVYDILAEEGYRYSSSINPVHHDHYGMPQAPRFAFLPVKNKAIEEYPISTVRLLGQNIPCAGGGYFRIFPYWITKRAIARVNALDGWPFIFYFHPWEVDPDQPRPEGVSAKSRFRHYTNLDKMEARLRRLLNDFDWGRMDHIFLDVVEKQEVTAS